MINAEFYEKLIKFKDGFSDLEELVSKYDIDDISELSENNIPMIEKLINYRIYQLYFYELLLKFHPERAISLLFDSYLSIDLSRSAQDRVADLGIMFDDIKDILGEEKLKEILDSPKFLLKNKRNPRVKEAIAFALDEN